MPNEALWHKDGHFIHLMLEKEAVNVSSVTCPDGKECKTEEDACVVQFFVERYGLDVNVGSCPAAADIEIAWTLIGKMRDLESAQLWIIPVEDYVFQAFVDAQLPTDSD